MYASKSRTAKKSITDVRSKHTRSEHMASSPDRCCLSCAALTSNSKTASDASRSTRFGPDSGFTKGTTAGTADGEELSVPFSLDRNDAVQGILLVRYLQLSYGLGPPQPTDMSELAAGRVQEFFWNQ